MTPSTQSPAYTQAAELDAIRAASDIVDIIGGYVRLKKNSHDFIGLCPFHTEKTPSFVVHPNNQTYKCFGCDAGGDVFRFIEQIDHVRFPQAKRILADRAGITLTTHEPARALSWKEKQRARDLAAQSAHFWLRAILHFRKMAVRLYRAERQACRWALANINDPDSDPVKWDFVWIFSDLTMAESYDAMADQIRDAKPADLLHVYLNFIAANPVAGRAASADLDHAQQLAAAVVAIIAAANTGSTKSGPSQGTPPCQ